MIVQSKNSILIFIYVLISCAVNGQNINRYSGFSKFNSEIALYQVKTTTQQTDTFKFKITTLNTEWLSCADYSPTDDKLQVKNIAALILAINPDLIALQEVGTSPTYPTIDTIVRKLGANWSGSIIPSTNENCGQNQGIIYKKAKIQLLASSLITNGGTSYDWSSGRYPAQYKVNFIAGDSMIPVNIVNIHAKAMSDATSYSRRKIASNALKSLFDNNSEYNTARIILIGDYNDYLTGTQCTTCSPADSPYKNFVDDLINFQTLTKGLTDPAYNNKPVIDNIIISNELFGNYVANSTIRETSATNTISNYSTTTSDHTPISANFNFIKKSGNSTGNQELQNTEISVYPGITSNILNIKTSGKISELIIFSISGEIVLRLNSDMNQINVSSLPTGIYQISIHTESGIKTTRFVKI